MLATVALPELKPAPIGEWCDSLGVHLKVVCPIRGCDSECHIVLDDERHEHISARWIAGDRGALDGLKRMMTERYWQHMGQEH